MTGLDTNILARYYVAAPAGDAATARQCAAAQALIDSGAPLMAAKTVLLELESVLRGHYGFDATAIAGVMRHLLALPHVTVEDRAAVEIALRHYTDGRNALDFADALHHAAYRHCQSMATFDDRKFARRAARLQLRPKVEAPARA